jgi:hypothetical protein
VVYIIVFLLNEYTIPLEQAQVVSCLLPPVALQLACSTFLKSHQGLNLSQICGMMVRAFIIRLCKELYSCLSLSLSLSLVCLFLDC